MEGEQVRDLVEDLLAYRGNIQILEDWLIKQGVARGPAQSICKTLSHAVNDYNRING